MLTLLNASELRLPRRDIESRRHLFSISNLYYDENLASEHVNIRDIHVLDR